MMADRALVFFGMLLIGIAQYLISGNSEAEDPTGAATGRRPDRQDPLL